MGGAKSRKRTRKKNQCRSRKRKRRRKRERRKRRKTTGSTMNERADIDGVTLSMPSSSSLFPADGLVEWECLYIDWEAVRILLTLIPLPCRPLLAPLTLAPSTFPSLSLSISL